MYIYIHVSTNPHILMNTFEIKLQTLKSKLF